MTYIKVYIFGTKWVTDPGSQNPFLVSNFTKNCFHGKSQKNHSFWLDIFRHLMLLLLRMRESMFYKYLINIFVQSQRQYPFSQKWNLSGRNFGLCLNFNHYLTLVSIVQLRLIKQLKQQINKCAQRNVECDIGKVCLTVNVLWWLW